jgi:putative membrane protein
MSGTPMKPMRGMPGMGSNAPAGHGAGAHVATHAGAAHAGVAHGMAGMSMGSEPPVNLHTVVWEWQHGPFAIGAVVVLVAVAAWYVMSVRRLEARGRHWSRWRIVSFLGGLLAVAVALAGSVATFANYTFTAHIIQHLLLMVVAPPLGALGAPMTLLLQTSRRSTKRRALRALRSHVFRVVSHPLPVFFLYYLSMYAFFLSGAIGYAMAHMWVMDLVNLGFLGGATLFWWPMVGIDPTPGGGMGHGMKIINLLIGIPIESFLGIALMEKTTTIASIYTLASTRAGGGLLWAASDLASMVGVAPIFLQWVRADARNARRIDARLDAGLPATPAVEGVGMAATLRSLRRG